MLSQAEVVRHLLDLGLLDAGVVLDGALRVEEVSRRNRSWRVQSDKGPGYFIKQGIGAEGAAFVAREASVYRFLNSRGPRGPLQQALPPFHGYDASTGLLVLGFTPGAESLRENHTRRGRVLGGAAAAIGCALAALHTIPPGELAPLEDPAGARPPAWPLFLHRPDMRIIREASSANLELIRMLQGFPEFCLLLDVLRAEWNPVALVHYDLKADNCVIAPRPGGSSRGAGIQLVDWEMAGPGDPCWDAGSIFSDFLGLWLLSMPVLPDTPPERFLDLAPFPLDRMHPAIRSFWSAYVRGLGLSGRAARETLLRSVRYSAARLLQSAFEQMQAAQRVTGNIVCLLQISWNILERPGEAATGLLGLPV